MNIYLGKSSKRGEFQSVFLALDVTTEKTDIAHILILIRGATKGLSDHADLLGLVSVRGITAVLDVKQAELELLCNRVPHLSQSKLLG